MKDTTALDKLKSRHAVSVTRRNAVLIIWLLVAISVAVTLIGAYKNFTQIPYWDMWNGFLDFYDKSQNGDIQTWWNPHNEHRIVLARLLFWSDLKWFNGDQLYLIAFNYIFPLCAAFIFYKFLSSEKPGAIRVTALAMAVTVAWLFSWTQSENFTWGFQSQFFLAQLIPLSGFYLLYRSTDASSGTRYWLGACALGILSVGTMANGVLALPLMFVYSLLTRQTLRRSAFLLVLTVAMLLLFFHGTQKPEGSSSVTSTIIEHPLGVLQYVLTYLGGPFYYFFGATRFALILAIGAAGLLVITVTLLTIQGLRSPTPPYLDLALIGFLAYIGATALGTATGRLVYGFEQALSSRYMTPAIMAWVALFILLALKYARRKTPDTPSPAVIAAAGILVVVTLPFQKAALTDQSDKEFEKEVAVLALAMDVNDEPQIQNVFPWGTMALDISRVAIKSRRSIFGNDTFAQAAQVVGSTNGAQPVNICQFHIDETTVVPLQPAYARITGWVFEPTTGQVPKTLLMTDSSGVVVGYAITGKPRKDVGRAVDRRARRSGFKGYILSAQLGKQTRFLGQSPACTFSPSP